MGFQNLISTKAILENVGPFLGKIVAWCSSHILATIIIFGVFFLCVMGASLLFDLKEGQVRNTLLTFFIFFILTIGIFFFLVALSRGLIKIPV